MKQFKRTTQQASKKKRRVRLWHALIRTRENTTQQLIPVAAALVASTVVAVFIPPLFIAPLVVLTGSILMEAYRYFRKHDPDERPEHLPSSSANFGHYNFRKAAYQIIEQENANKAGSKKHPSKIIYPYEQVTGQCFYD